MNREFTAKLLRHLNNKKNKNNKGFTLIELLVVVIIIGVLAAVALPNLLAQVGKARESEAKTATGTINRSEQTYHFENRTFTAALIDDAALAANNDLGVIIDSRYYTFSIPAGDAANSGSTATSTDANANGTRDYAGGIAFLNGNYATGICQATAVGGAAPALTVTVGAPAACVGGNVLQ